jgi:hypothetical protein
LGLPLMVAIIGGEPRRFRPLIDLYRETGLRCGHSAGQLTVGIHVPGFVGDTTAQCSLASRPSWSRKIVAVDEALDGLARISFQMTNVILSHAKMLHSIELLGTRVAPAVRKALRA